MRVLLRSFVLFAFTCCASFCWAGDSAPAHPEMVVTAQWLAEHLKDPEVVVLHVAEKKSEYLHAHIPGAKLLLVDDFVQGEDVELPALDKLKDAFEKLGISDETRVVIYTTAWYPMAARAYYTLDYLGHGDKAALLDGGMEHWKLENRPLQKVKIARRPAANSRPGSTLKFVRNLLRRSKLPMARRKPKPWWTRVRSKVTSRDICPARFTFTGRRRWWIAKHDPVFLSTDKLRALFDARGIKPGEKLVTYCVVGLQASHLYFVARYLGYDAAMYDGSTHEWSMMNNLPLTKGDSPR